MVVFLEMDEQVKFLFIGMYSKQIVQLRKRLIMSER